VPKRRYRHRLLAGQDLQGRLFSSGDTQPLPARRQFPTIPVNAPNAVPPLTAMARLRTEAISGRGRRPLMANQQGRVDRTTHPAMIEAAAADRVDATYWGIASTTITMKSPDPVRR